MRIIIPLIKMPGSRKFCQGDLNDGMAPNAGWVALLFSRGGGGGGGEGVHNSYILKENYVFDYSRYWYVTRLIQLTIMCTTCSEPIS